MHKRPSFVQSVVYLLSLGGVIPFRSVSQVKKAPSTIGCALTFLRILYFQRLYHAFLARPDAARCAYSLMQTAGSSGRCCGIVALSAHLQVRSDKQSVVWLLGAERQDAGIIGEKKNDHWTGPSLNLES